MKSKIIEEIVELTSKHVGDEFFKRIYAISLLSPGIINVEEPLHIHIYGAPETGKTDLQTRYMELVPKEHKDIASDFTPKVLMYSNLEPGTIITLNDKVFNDQIGALLNQVCDSTSWRKGRICATTVGKERVNLEFPPRCVFWMNSNKRITEYGLREVDPLAIEGRFITFEKTYSDDEKKRIFVERNIYSEENDEDKILRIRKYINNIYENPRSILCSRELRDLIWFKSTELGIKSIRVIGRSLTMCQVMALVDDRDFVEESDVEEVFKLLKIQKVPLESREDNTESIRKLLLPEAIFKSLPVDKKVLYSSEELLKNKNIDDICAKLKIMKENGIIGEEILKIGISRKLVYCYYLVKG